MWTKKKVFISKYARIFTNSGVKTKNSSSSQKNARIFTNSGVKPQKKKVLITKSAKKQFLLTNSGVTTCILEVSGLKLHFSGTKPVTFFGHNPRLGGTVLVWRAHAVNWGGHGPGMPPVASGLRQVHSNLSNCNYRIYVKEILLEIGFIEEMRTIQVNTEVPHTFFYNFLDLRKCGLIRLTPYHFQPCIRNFVTV